MRSELSTDPLSFAMNRGLTDSNNNSLNITPIDILADREVMNASIKKE